MRKGFWLVRTAFQLTNDSRYSFFKGHMIPIISMPRRAGAVEIDATQLPNYLHGNGRKTIRYHRQEQLQWMTTILLDYSDATPTHDHAAMWSFP